MNLNRIHAIALSAAALAVAGCASQTPLGTHASGTERSQASDAATPQPANFAPAVREADVPLAVRHPLGQSIFLEALASGVQIYECNAKTGTSSSRAHEWVLLAPEATLVDRSGRILGKHFAGPTWESVDGSSVTGLVRAQDPGPTPTAVPWVLLTVKGTTGSGVLTQTKTIQRVSTVGGVAPSEACDAGKAGQVVRVPYRATYNFYRVGK